MLRCVELPCFAHTLHVPLCRITRARRGTAILCAGAGGPHLRLALDLRNFARRHRFAVNATLASSNVTPNYHVVLAGIVLNLVLVVPLGVLLLLQLQGLPLHKTISVVVRLFPGILRKMTRCVEL